MQTVDRHARSMYRRRSESSKVEMEPYNWCSGAVGTPWRGDIKGVSELNTNITLYNIVQSIILV